MKKKHLKRKYVQLKHSDVKSVRNKLLKKQNGICPICKRKIENPVLDHSHKKRHGGTGLIRGVVCSTCNRFIGVIENNVLRNKLDFALLPEVLINIAHYINTEHLPYIHPSEAPKKKLLKKQSYNKLARLHQIKFKTNRKLPAYPKSKTLTKPLAAFYKIYNLKPEFYK